MYISANVLSIDYLLEVAYYVHVEYVDGEVVLLTHGSGSEVHYFESQIVNLVVGDFVELCGCGVLFWVGCVDAINASALKHHIGLNLNTTER